MHLNIKTLMEACDLMGVGYQAYIKDGNMLILDIKNKPTFVNCKTPLNTESISFVCQDKSYFYQLTKDLVPQPKTTSYLTPETEGDFLQYCQFSSLDNIAEDIEKQHLYPLIVKPNRGAQGVNVRKVSNRTELHQALQAIFDPQSKHFDYKCIAQAWVNIKKEYRAVFLDGQLELLYEKNLDDAEFTGNLSPHHWQGSRPLEVDSPAISHQVQKLIKPLLDEIAIRYAGFDIVIDVDNNWCLLEANTGPALEIYMGVYGQYKIIELYKKMIQSLIDNPY